MHGRDEVVRSRLRAKDTRRSDHAMLGSTWALADGGELLGEWVTICVELQATEFEGRMLFCSVMQRWCVTTGQWVAHKQDKESYGWLVSTQADTGLAW